MATPQSSAKRAMVFAKMTAWDFVCMKAARPNFTSSTRASNDSESFLERMDAVISGIDGTVPVTSRSAYMRRSAGTIVADCAPMATPRRCTWSMISVSDNPVRKPGIDSSLSSVPPVMPRPRPEIIGTRKPRQASKGASGKDTLSPTPPVECLSTSGLRSLGNFSFVPESRMASVSARVSRGSNPRKKTAMRNAAIW